MIHEDRHPKGPDVYDMDQLSRKAIELHNTLTEYEWLVRFHNRTYRQMKGLAPYVAPHPDLQKAIEQGPDAVRVLEAQERMKKVKAAKIFCQEVKANPAAWYILAQTFADGVLIPARMAGLGVEYFPKDI